MNVQELLDESDQFEARAELIQKGTKVGLSAKAIDATVQQYGKWYANCLAILPDNYVGRFTREYEGNILSFGIKSFLNSPTETNPLFNAETAPLLSYWLYPYNSAFRNRLRAQRQILREVLARQESETAHQEQVSQGLKRETREGFVFIAMPMDANDPNLDDVHDAIKEVAARLNLLAERVDDPQTNERITYRILESLATAEFVVADLTHNKPNVYFEAGFAHALGKNPIYLARADTRIEFDVKDYPVLFFSSMRELKERLQARLEGLQRHEQH